MPLPHWMHEAISDKVLTHSEAQEIHALCKASETDEVLMPEHLHSAIEKLALWEMEAPETLH